MQIPKRNKSKKFKNIKNDFNISLQKYNELKNELKILKEKKLDKQIIKVQELAELGDFSENAAYQIEKGKLRSMNYRILEIEDILKNAKIIKKNKNNKIIQLGNTVILENEKKEKIKFTILGSSEINLKENIISQSSPLGQALLNHKKNDLITLKINNKIFKYKIIDIL